MARLGPARLGLGDLLMKVTITLTGGRPMLMHNGRLANPLDPYTRQKKTLSGKRKKTDEDIARLLEIEARGAAYETNEGLLGLPTQNVWRSAYDAAKAFKRGEDIKRGLVPVDPEEVAPLAFGGKHRTVEEHLASSANIDFRPVAQMRQRVMRARPIVRGWQSVHTFELLPDVLDPSDLEPILARAGRLVGVGDWRPTYGTYAAHMEVVE